MADVIAVCGSYRTGSLNRKLLRLQIREVEQAGLTVEQVDLKALALPVYDGDLEEAQGLPAGAKEWKAKLTATPGLLVCTPEYNSSIPGGFKNFIDWLSRPQGNPFQGRVVSVSTASPGPFGGVRSTITVKAIFTHLGAWVVPGAMNLAKADQAFDDAGELKEAWMKKALSAQIASFVDGVKRFK